MNVLTVSLMRPIKMETKKVPITKMRKEIRRSEGMMTFAS